jgi:hypothetical protein
MNAVLPNLIELRRAATNPRHGAGLRTMAPEKPHSIVILTFIEFTHSPGVIGPVVNDHTGSDLEQSGRKSTDLFPSRGSSRDIHRYDEGRFTAESLAHGGDPLVRPAVRPVGRFIDSGEEQAVDHPLARLTLARGVEHSFDGVPVGYGEDEDGPLVRQSRTGTRNCPQGPTAS